jgi:hypothetical protein
MDSYIEKRSFDELVNETVPESKYEDVVQDILRDKKYNWRLNYYKSDGKSSYDVSICRMNMEIDKLTANINTNERLMKTLEENISTSTQKKTKETCDRQFVLAEEEIRHDKARLDELRELKPKWEWNRYLELGLESTLRRVRNSFILNHDEDLLRKGVTWACAYAVKNRYQLYYGIESKEQEKLESYSDF